MIWDVDICSQKLLSRDQTPGGSEMRLAGALSLTQIVQIAGNVARCCYGTSFHYL